jgi:hypothetical protein
MTMRLEATLQAVQTVRPALEKFYASLSDEQKERFNLLGPQNAATEAQASVASQAVDTCKQPKQGLTNLPIDGRRCQHREAGTRELLRFVVERAEGPLQPDRPAAGANQRLKPGPRNEKGRHRSRPFYFVGVTRQSGASDITPSVATQIRACRNPPIAQLSA